MSDIYTMIDELHKAVERDREHRLEWLWRISYILSFDPVGDGYHDDTLAIQIAIIRTGGIKLEAGTYNICYPIHLANRQVISEKLSHPILFYAK